MNTTSTPNATTMPISARNPRHRATATTTTAKATASRDQRPRPLVVVEGVGRGAGRVDLAGDPDLVTDRELGLARPAAELQQRVGARVRSGVDRDERLHTVGAVALRGCRWAVSTPPTDW